MKICPYCKTENHDDAIICKTCQHNITKAAITAEGLNGCSQLIANCGCLTVVIGVIIMLILLKIFL